MTLVKIVVVLYFLVMLAIGFICARKYIHTISDFLVAGRKFPWYLVTFGLLATYIGANAAIGVAGLGYQYGIAAGWYFVPFSVAIITFAFVLSKKLVALRVFTLGDILELRYSFIERIIAAVWIFFVYLLVTSAQIVAMGTIFKTILGWDLLPSMFASTGIFVVYTIMGGMWAVTITDFVQTIILLLGFYLLGPFFSVKAAGGLAGIEAKLGPQFLSLTNLPGILLIGFFSFFFFTWVSQDTYQRIFAAKDVKTAYLSCILTGLVTLLLGFGASLIGASAHVIFPHLKPEASIVALILQTLPSPLNAIVIASLLAVIMSTADSVILVCSMSITKDFYQRFLKPDATDAEMILVTRISIVVVALLSFLIACRYPFVLKVVIYAISIYVAAFVPVILAAFYWKRATKTGAFFSMISGGLSVLVLMIFFPELAVPSLAGLPISTGILIIISLVTKSDPEKTSAFLERVKNKLGEK